MGPSTNLPAKRRRQLQEKRMKMAVAGESTVRVMRREGGLYGKSLPPALSSQSSWVYATPNSINSDFEGPSTPASARLVKVEDTGISINRTHQREPSQNLPCTPTRDHNDAFTTRSQLLSPPSTCRSNNPEFIECRLLNTRKITHQWVLKEKILLCVLRRFFVQDTGSRGWKTIARLMNAYFPDLQSKFDAGKCSAYYRELQNGTSRGDGEEAWLSVWQRNFMEAKDEIIGILRTLQELASSMGVSLVASQHEQVREKRKPIRRGGRLKKPKRTDVRHDVARILSAPDVKSQSVMRACSPITSSGTISKFPLISRPIHPQPRPNIWHESEDIAAPTINQVPELLFRAYSNVNSTINRPESHHARRFFDSPHISIPRAPKPHFSESAEYENFSFDVANHVNKVNVASPFISTTPSLVWAVYRLFGEGGDSSLAIINGKVAHRNTFVYDASSLVKDLRREKKYTKRYGARFENLVWGQVTEDAIHATIKLQHLILLAQGSAAVRKLLRLDTMGESRNIKSLRNTMLLDPVLLDDQAGKAIAKIMLLLGFSPSSKSEQITDLVYNICQGWVVSIPWGEADCISIAFRAFYLDLIDHCSEKEEQLGTEAKLRQAFEIGVHRAAQDLLKDFAQSRSP